MAKEQSTSKSIRGANRPCRCSGGSGDPAENSAIVSYFTPAEFFEKNPSWNDNHDLIFRFDWVIRPSSECLLLYAIDQQSGRYRIYRVDHINAADEPAFRAWLQARLNHLVGAWHPLTVAKPGATESDI